MIQKFMRVKGKQAKSWGHKLTNNTLQPVFQNDQKFRTKIQISQE